MCVISELRAKYWFYVNTNLIQLCIVKVKKLWEGHNIWKESPTCFDVYSVNVKTSGRFFSNFCGLSRKTELYRRRSMKKEKCDESRIVGDYFTWQCNA